MKGIIAQILFTVILFFIIGHTSIPFYNTLVYGLFVGVLGYILVKRLIQYYDIKAGRINSEDVKPPSINTIYIAVVFFIFLYMFLRNVYDI